MGQECPDERQLYCLKMRPKQAHIPLPNLNLSSAHKQTLRKMQSAVLALKV